MGLELQQVVTIPNHNSKSFFSDIPLTNHRLDMKNHIKKQIFPGDLSGYVKLTPKAKNNLIHRLLNSHSNKIQIAKTLDVPDYWYWNFVRNDKIHTSELKKLVAFYRDLNLESEIECFTDDKGSSSIPFTGKFPISYDPLWHFIFCLSVGDGNIRKGSKNQFVWYQKPKGMIPLIQLIKHMGFIYSPTFSTTKRGLCLPQLIRKVGSIVTGLDSGEQITQNIVKVSSHLGRNYEIAFLMAFFLDEAGMSKPTTSEITLHQEGNIMLLGQVERLLNKYGIDCTRNKKGTIWNIRFKAKGIERLSELFFSMKKYNITLLHRQEVFDTKVLIAKANRRKPK